MRRLTLALLGLLALGPARADDGYVSRLILEKIDVYDAAGRDLYQGFLQYFATHREEVCRQLSGACPPPDQMQGMAIMGTKSRLIKRMDEAKADLIAKMGGDEDARARGDAVFGAISKRVLEDMDKLGR